MPAGYSGTPLPRKLGIKEGHRVGTINAPLHFRELLVDLPHGVRFVEVDEGEPLDVIVLFATELEALRQAFPTAAARIQPNGGLWVGWPKKSSPLAGELDGGTVRTTGLEFGLVDNKVCAIDQDWSGLRFVYRIEDRPDRR